MSFLLLFIHLRIFLTIYYTNNTYMKRITFFTALAVLSLLSVTSCSKDDKDDNEGNEEFKTISYQVIHHQDSLPFFRMEYTLTFNQDGFLTRKEEKHYLKDDDGSWLYIVHDVATVSYDKSAFKATLTEDRVAIEDPTDKLHWVIYFDFDDSWKITSWKENDNEPYIYTYTNDGYLSKTTTIGRGDPNQIIGDEYRWENGNLISETSLYDSQVNTYTYSDELNPFRDAMMDPITSHWLLPSHSFGLGLEGKHIAHLPLSLTQNLEGYEPSHFYFDYKKDSQGRIIEIDSWHEDDKGGYAAIILN